MVAVLLGMRFYVVAGSDFSSQPQPWGELLQSSVPRGLVVVSVQSPAGHQTQLILAGVFASYRFVSVWMKLRVTVV